MVVAAQWYPQGMGAFMRGEIDWVADDVKIALMDSVFTFDDAHDFWDDISASDYSSASGYTADGDSLASNAVVETDSSALTARANTTAYVVGDIVRTAADSTRVFLCVVAGTSAGSEPGGMATLGSLREIVDSGVTWVNVGRGVTILDADANAWTGLDQTGTDAAVIYMDSTVDSTSPLLGYISFGQVETPTDLTVTPPAEGYLLIPSGVVL